MLFLHSFYLILRIQEKKMTIKGYLIYILIYFVILIILLLIFKGLI